MQLSVKADILLAIRDVGGVFYFDIARGITSMRYNMERKQEVVLPRDIAKSGVGVGGNSTHLDLQVWMCT